MNTVERELKNNNINIICPIDKNSVSIIANYVATVLSTKFPNLKINYNLIFNSIANLPMYIADMPTNSTGACYLYINSSLYFRKGLSFEDMKKLAVHECIHYFQEIKDEKGKLKRLGLCGYSGKRAYGNALNEAAVQMMASYANNEKPEKVTYFGIKFPSDSPNYYPIICNLMKQLGYLTGFPVLFESTFYSNELFFDKFKEAVGEKNAFKIQRNFEKIVILESRVNQLSNIIRTEDLGHGKFKKVSNYMVKCKEEIKKVYFDTQNLIITSYFDGKIANISTPQQIEEYRKYLYSFSNLIGTSDDYTFFNDYYIQKMSEIDAKYEMLHNENKENVSLKVINESIFSKILRFFKNSISGQYNVNANANANANLNSSTNLNMNSKEK